MSTQTTKSEYMLLFKGTLWDRDLSAEELQQIMTRWMSWPDRLTREGKVKPAQPPSNQGKTSTWRKGPAVDGPFAEAKEAIGGYFLLSVSFEAAVEIAKQCPALKHGVTVEVRPVIEQCASMDRVEQNLAGTAG